jgi:hypothetical protein
MKLGTGTHDGFTQLLADLVSTATIHTHTHTIMGEMTKYACTFIYFECRGTYGGMCI